jgi:hypothetical protein
LPGRSQAASSPSCSRLRSSSRRIGARHPGQRDADRRRRRHIYGTQGEDRCSFDEIEQAPLLDAALPAHSYRVSARGFCVAPARALDGEGSVLLTRFDFAGLVTWSEDAAPAAVQTGADR